MAVLEREIHNSIEGEFSHENLTKKQCVKHLELTGSIEQACKEVFAVLAGEEQQDTMTFDEKLERWQKMVDELNDKED